MNKNIAILAALSVATLTACGSKIDADEKNFVAALTQYFDKKGDLCLNTKRWPADLYEIDFRLQKTMQAGHANQMAALEAAGLVKSEDADDFQAKATDGRANIKRFTLTDAAKPFLLAKSVPAIGISGEKQTDLCWGKKALDRVVKWEGPMKLGEYQEVVITYTYKINSLAEWAKKPEVQAAFPFVKSILDGAGRKESRHAIKLTSQGWEAKGLD